jgi:pimeloyl-ACP methyl ester carboxylesterase
MKKRRCLLLAAVLLLVCTGGWLLTRQNTSKTVTNAPAADTASAETLAEENTLDAEDHTIQVNGVSLYYETAGSGKPVLLVHGNGGDHTTLSAEIRQLVSSGYKVYAPDTRGQGQNEPEEEYHYTDLAEDMYQLITQLNLDHPAYYGWSDGGIIGLLLEIRHPDALSLLAISGTNLYPAGIDDDVLQDIRDDYDATGNPLEKMMLEEPDITPAELKTIQIPVLVTAGSDDIIKPEHTQLIADSIPNSELKIIEDEDHGSYIEDSPIAGSLLVSFLQEHGY